MEYITSRRKTIPRVFAEFEADLRFNLWHRKQWPYEELVTGDTLYWYETPSQSIVWKSKVVDVDRFQYNSRQEVKRKLVTRFRNFDANIPYFETRPERGYCLALKLKALERVNLPKPANFLFPRIGWLKINGDIAIRWLSQSEQVDDVILDGLAPNGSLIERIHQLNISMMDVSPQRVASIISHTVRKDTEIVEALKTLCEFKCQFPGCDARIPKRNGGFYIEVAHVEPVSEGGRSVIGNLLVLCPNHHKEFDHGSLEIVEQTEISIRGKLNGKAFHIWFPGTSDYTQ